MIHTIIAMSEGDVSEAVSNIIGGIQGETERDFQTASANYNSVFFKGLPSEFVQQACSSLKAKFPSYVNSFWDKQSQQIIP